MIFFIITILLIITAIILLWPPKKINIKEIPFPENWEHILTENILFFKKLDEIGKAKFRERIKKFLYEVRITGVETKVDDKLKILVASSAIIPIFSFDEWEYLNLSEVLIYDGMVETYQNEDDKNLDKILGQVTPFQNKHVLLLSRQQLEKGFEGRNGKSNVGFHEFAHLVDEADGDIDGFPGILLSKDLLMQWTQLMYKEIEKIKKGESDINIYGLTNHAEFFAVVIEYFFKSPEKFKEKHPELYEVLARAFRTK